MSGADDDQVRRAAIESGATRFLEKPFDATTLTELTQELLAAGLPLAAVGVEAETNAPPPEHSSTLRVLLAEDDELVAALVVDRLVRDGCEIRHHPDGASALADALEWVPDLVILDVMMPKMNGFEVLSRLRDAQQTADVPVIILTGRGREDDVVRGFDLGARDYVVKPFSPAELAVRVRRHAAKT
jgi:DNA-binding response OmpR family regulator